MKKFIRSVIALFGAILIGVSGAHALHGAAAQESTCEDNARCSAVNPEECRWDAPDRKCEIDVIFPEPDGWIVCQTSVGECPWS
jgi:hypothetical protein